MVGSATGIAVGITGESKTDDLLGILVGLDNPWLTRVGAGRGATRVLAATDVGSLGGPDVEVGGTTLER